MGVFEGLDMGFCTTANLVKKYNNPPVLTFECSMPSFFNIPSYKRFEYRPLYARDEKTGPGAGRSLAAGGRSDRKIQFKRRMQAKALGGRGEGFTRLLVGLGLVFGLSGLMTGTGLWQWLAGAMLLAALWGGMKTVRNHKATDLGRGGAVKDGN